MVYACGQFEIDLGRRELRACGVAFPLGGRAFEILEVLVRAAGKLVTKDDFIDGVWGGAIVEENTLQVHVSAIRKALGADRGLLKTVSGRGYRLLGNWSSQRDLTLEATMGVSPPAFMEPTAGNLPQAVSDLIGRTKAVQHLRDLVSAYRMVTLTGVGGIGKSSLALEVARTLRASFQDDVWLVELASLSNPNLIPSAVAEALGLQLGEAEITAVSVARKLDDRNALLVLDNCEHVIEAGALFVGVLVRTCPGISIIATSREALRTDGERVYRVPPLDIPPDPRPGQQEDFLEHSAVQFFVARMTTLNASAAPHDDDLGVVATICRRLDGIPLAIEFAAARAATLGLEHVISGLDDRFALLTAGRRTALPRHRTLRATLDWSYQLLPTSEQRQLRCLAIFSAGFTLEAAVTILRGPEYPEASIVECVANLIAKSLVVLETPGADARFRLLETIRAYAFGRLAESGEVARTAQRHAAYFRDLFSTGASGSKSLQSRDRLTLYRRELDNVRSALDWAFSGSGDAAIGIILTAAFVSGWHHLSLMVECRDRTELALAHLESASNLNEQLRLQLHVTLGVALLQTSGYLETSGVLLETAFEVAVSLNSTEWQLRALWAMWNYRFYNGENHAASLLAEQFSRIAHKTGELADVLVGDRLMGTTMHYAGNQSEARHLLERVVKHYVAPVDQRHTEWFFYDQRLLARAILGRVFCLQGFAVQAMNHVQTSLDEAEAADHKQSICYVLSNALCPITLTMGDLTRAQPSVATLVTLGKTHSPGYWNFWGACVEGELMIRGGEYRAGTMLLRAAIDRCVKAGWTVSYFYPAFLGALAEGLAEVGKLDEAVVTIEDALRQADRDGQHWNVPELLRVKAEVLLKYEGGRFVSAGEDCLSQALTLARQQGARFWELRAALSLARIRVRQDRQPDAQEILAALCGECTDSPEIADLRSARALLGSLSAQTGGEGASQVPA